jgi:hypothetical protein
LKTPYAVYLAIEKMREEWLSNYRELSKALIEAETVKKIRESINKESARRLETNNLLRKLKS